MNEISSNSIKHLLKKQLKQQENFLNNIEIENNLFTEIKYMIAKHDMSYERLLKCIQLQSIDHLEKRLNELHEERKRVIQLKNEIPKPPTLNNVSKVSVRTDLADKYQRYCDLYLISIKLRKAIKEYNNDLNSEKQQLLSDIRMLTRKIEHLRINTIAEFDRVN